MPTEPGVLAAHPHRVQLLGQRRLWSRFFQDVWPFCSNRGGLRGHLRVMVPRPPSALRVGPACPLCTDRTGPTPSWCHCPSLYP